MKTLAALLVCAAFAGSNTFALGPSGHELVGAIADERLSGSPAGKAVSELLGGVPLARAATLPDEIKGWDSFKPDDPHGIGGFPNKQLVTELWEFWKANPPPERATQEIPSHHWFHYTDVPVEENRYDEGKRGRLKWDIVQMVPFCVGVLRGDEPQDNSRKITKAVALVLLAHFIGDIHQPLHVGAQYFAKGNGAPVNGDADESSLEDEGGNSILLHYATLSNGGKTAKLHGFWDKDAVAAAIKQINDEIEKDIQDNGARSFEPPTHAQLVHWLAVRPPANWMEDPAADSVAWTKRRADEILPLAREAHRRLNFEGVHLGTSSHGTPIAKGEAREAAAQDGKTYLDWASDVLAVQLHVAGWRLSELLQSVWK